MMMSSTHGSLECGNTTICGDDTTDLSTMLESKDFARFHEVLLRTEAIIQQQTPQIAKSVKSYRPYRSILRASTTFVPSEDMAATVVSTAATPQPQQEQQPEDNKRRRHKSMLEQVADEILSELREQEAGEQAQINHTRVPSIAASNVPESIPATTGTIIILPQSKHSSIKQTTLKITSTATAVLHHNAVSPAVIATKTDVPNKVDPSAPDRPSSSVPSTSDASSHVQPSSEHFNRGYWPGTFTIWAYGLATILTSCYYDWNYSLTAGFGSYLIAQILMGIAYVIMISSLAEIVSSTTFAGGTYGMARVVLGFYPGFLMACLEVCEYLSYTSMAGVAVSSFICDEFAISYDYIPLLLVGYYVGVMVFAYSGGRIFWTMLTSLGIFCLIIGLIYVFGASRHTDITRASLGRNTASTSALTNWFAGGLAGFMSTLPTTSWAFGGIECTALLTDMIDKPTENYPKGAISSVLTLFVMMILMLFIGSASMPGFTNGFLETSFLMDYGFASFGVPPRPAQWFVIIGQYAMAFGFLLPAGKLLQAMADSNLLPQWFMLSHHHGSSHSVGDSSATSATATTGTPPTTNVAASTPTLRPSLFLACFISYCFAIINYYQPEFNVTNIGVVCGFITYLSTLYAFTKLRADFSNIHREFRSPFGIIGAMYAFIIFILGIISIIGFYEDDYTAICVVMICVILTGYYFLFAVKTQILSDSEQKSLLVLYVMVMNRRMRQSLHDRLHHKKQHGWLYSTIFGNSNSDGHGHGRVPHLANNKVWGVREGRNVQETVGITSDIAVTEGVMEISPAEHV